MFLVFYIFLNPSVLSPGIVSSVKPSMAVAGLEEGKASVLLLSQEFISAEGLPASGLSI